MMINATGLGCAKDWYAITLDTDLPIKIDALDCTTSGNVNIVSETGNEETVTLNAGLPYAAAAVRVKLPSNGTVAQGIIGLCF